MNFLVNGPLGLNFKRKVRWVLNWLHWNRRLFFFNYHIYVPVFIHWITILLGIICRSLNGRINNYLLLIILFLLFLNKLFIWPTKFYQKLLIRTSLLINLCRIEPISLHILLLLVHFIWIRLLVIFYNGSLLGQFDIKHFLRWSADAVIAFFELHFLDLEYFVDVFL